MNSALAFQRFAASCTYTTHGYLTIEDGTLVYNQQQLKPSYPTLRQITHLAIRTFQESPTCETQQALKIFKASLERKLNDCLADLFYDTAELRKMILKIKRVLKSQPVEMGSEEAVFRLRFLSQLPQQLGVKHAPKTQTVTKQWQNGVTTHATVKEWEIIEWLSKQVYQSEAVAAARVEEKWRTYSAIMTGAYKGDHLLISDDREHHRTQELIALGAIMRTSSHNEGGKEIIGWNDSGSAIYNGNSYDAIKSLSDSDHHWSFEGDHVAEILFFAADMRKRTDGSLILAKTARQVHHLIQAGKLKGETIDQESNHHYTALQFEFSPDCEGMQLLNSKFWKHKVYSSYLYRARKKLGYEDANVGPYGYGRTDRNPRVLNKIPL